MSAVQPIRIAILAMGGEGGGVLADWLVDLAEHNGHLAQSTSVPGVAQRTGATIYYVEMFPAEAARQAGATPVLALMPLPGDVDLVLASELMEAARAVQRGLVTPDRTTLVASTHRVYTIAEKIALGDGRADDAALLAQARAAARRFVGYDMAEAALASGSLVSAVIFGTLAGAGALPFERAEFEATIERGGVGVQASLTAFRAAFERAARGEPAASAPPSSAVQFKLPTAAHPEVQALLDRAAKAYRGETLRIVIEGLRRLVDYQDPAYGALYLGRLAALDAVGCPHGASLDALQRDVARHLALWMSFEDTLRVADLKTRGARFERVRSEVGATPAQVLAIAEYLHPRLQEIAETLPPRLGRWLLASGAPRRLLQRLTSKGRVLHTSSLRGFLALWALASLRRWRRATLRFAIETERIEAWLADIRRLAALDPWLALEIARCQRLVKGYGETHERGLRSFATLRAAWQRDPSTVTPAVLAELREAALADEHGRALKAALSRHALV